MVLHINGRLRENNEGVRTEITSDLHEVVCKIMNLIHRQCEMKMIIKEPSSTWNLNTVVIHSLFTCYSVNTPHMLNGGSIPLLLCQKPVFLWINYVLIHQAFELCKKYWVFKVNNWIIWHIYRVSFLLSVSIHCIFECIKDIFKWIKGIYQWSKDIFKWINEISK